MEILRRVILTGSYPYRFSLGTVAIQKRNGGMSMKTMIRGAVMAGILWGAMAGTAFAKDILLASVTNNHDALNGRLYLVVDEEDKATGLKLHDLADGKTQEWQVSALAKGGAVIKQEGRHEVIVLKSNDFEIDRGGHFKLDMLYNGATGKRHSVDLKVDFDGTNWKIFSNGEAVKRFHFIVKKVAFLGVVGIKSVQFK
tara:strand:- start:124021 stop:124614 length:594 start_codon:yes stop_codon:yes gene_type:complete